MAATSPKDDKAGFDGFLGPFVNVAPTGEGIPTVASYIGIMMWAQILAANKPPKNVQGY